MRCSFDFEFSVDAGKVNLDSAWAVIVFGSDFGDIAVLGECLKDFLFGRCKQFGLGDDCIGSPKVINDFDVGVGHQEVFDEIRCEIVTGVNANSDVLLFHRPLHLPLLKQITETP